MKKLIAIFLGLILLVSNMGVALATHYCGGSAVKSKLAVGISDLDCGMAMADCNYIPGKNLILNSQSCCENHYQIFQTDDHLSSAMLQINHIEDFHFNILSSPLNITYFPEAEITRYNNHSPPYPEKSIQVLFQTFLI